MFKRDAIGFRAVIVTLVLLYGATLGILGFAHVHLLLHDTTARLDAARPGAPHDAAPTCVVCFRMNSSQPTVPEQQLFPGKLPESLASLPPPVASVARVCIPSADGRAPPLSPA